MNKIRLTHIKSLFSITHLNWTILTEFLKVSLFLEEASSFIIILVKICLLNLERPTFSLDVFVNCLFNLEIPKPELVFVFTSLSYFWLAILSGIFWIKKSITAFLKKKSISLWFMCSRTFFQIGLFAPSALSWLYIYNSHSCCEPIIDPRPCYPYPSYQRRSWEVVVLEGITSDQSTGPTKSSFTMHSYSSFLILGIF